MIKRILAFALLGLAVSTGANAQGHQHMQDQRQGMMHAMMGECAIGGVPGPAALLEVRTELALTDAQVERLQALDNKVAGGRAPHMNQMMGLHQKAAQILNSDNPDYEQYKSLLEQMHTAMISFHVENAKLAVEARSLLQPDQRSKLDELIKVGQGKLGACMQGKHEPVK